MDVPWLTWPGKEFDKYHILVPSGWFDLQKAGTKSVVRARLSGTSCGLQSWYWR
jgi:hypothetical protein